MAAHNTHLYEMGRPALASALLPRVSLSQITRINSWEVLSVWSSASMRLASAFWTYQPATVALRRCPHEGIAIIIPGLRGYSAISCGQAIAAGILRGRTSGAGSLGVGMTSADFQQVQYGGLNAKQQGLQLSSDCSAVSPLWVCDLPDPR